jgi:hypothetical protein
MRLENRRTSRSRREVHLYNDYDYQIGRRGVLRAQNPRAWGTFSFMLLTDVHLPKVDHTLHLPIRLNATVSGPLETIKVAESCILVYSHLYSTILHRHKRLTTPSPTN